MPNTLAHFAVQGGASRGMWRRLDARWIYLGGVLPDVPWILRRALTTFEAPLDPFDLRLYTMAQASLAGTLLLVAAVAAVAAAPRLVLLVLGTGAVLHLLLDAVEAKWGNGVHLMAPFSWRLISFDVLAGEGAVLLVLTAAGAVIVGWELWRPRTQVVGLALRPRRLALSGALLAAYFTAPLPFLSAIEESGSGSVRALRDVRGRPGRSVRFDRAVYVPTPAGGSLEIWTGEQLRVTGRTPPGPGRVSLEGTFVAPRVLRVERLAVHRRNRDWPSYVGLALLGVLWLRPALRGPRGVPL